MIDDAGVVAAASVVADAMSRLLRNRVIVTLRWINHR
jgi:hypothetical protein